MSETTLNKPEFSREMKVFLEQRFFSTGEPPSTTEVQEQFSLSREEILLLLPEINAYRKANNLVPNRAGSLLSPEQFMLAQLLLNPSDRRSLRAKLKELNVTMLQYDRWRRDPAFMNYFRQQVQSRFKDADVIADLELVKLLEDGDLKAITYYNEVTGRHQTSDQVNLTRVLAMVMEVLVQFVSADVLRNVAAGLEERLSGVLDVQEVQSEIGPPPVGSETIRLRLGGKRD
jgi:hypothetical protein